MAERKIVLNLVHLFAKLDSLQRSTSSPLPLESSSLFANASFYCSTPVTFLVLELEERSQSDGREQSKSM